DCAIGQADPVDETKWIASQAEIHSWIGAIVGRADLTDPRIGEVLDRHMAASHLFRGIRMFSTPELWNSTEFKRGLGLLRDKKLIFDLDADPETIAQAGEMAEACDGVNIILGHAGFPKLRTKEYFQRWRKGMKGLGL